MIAPNFLYFFGAISKKIDLWVSLFIGYQSNHQSLEISKKEQERQEKKIVILVFLVFTPCLLGGVPLPITP